MASTLHHPRDVDALVASNAAARERSADLIEWAKRTITASQARYWPEAASRSAVARPLRDTWLAPEPGLHHGHIELDFTCAEHGAIVMDYHEDAALPPSLTCPRCGKRLRSRFVQSA